MYCGYTTWSCKIGKKLKNKKALRLRAILSQSLRCAKSGKKHRKRDENVRHNRCHGNTRLILNNKANGLTIALYIILVKVLWRWPCYFSSR